MGEVLSLSSPEGEDRSVP